MTQEKSFGEKFRPNIPEDIKTEQLALLEKAKKRLEKGEAKGEIDHDEEYFLVKVPLKDGTVVIENIPKNTGNIMLNKKEHASVDEAIEAVQRFYPEFDKPSLEEAVRRLREYKNGREK